MPNGHWDCRYESLGLTNSKRKPFALPRCSECSFDPRLLLTAKDLPTAPQAWRVGSVASKLRVSLFMACPRLQPQGQAWARISPRRVEQDGWGRMGLEQRLPPPPSWCEDTRSRQGGQRLRKGWPEHSSRHQASLSGAGGHIAVRAGTLPHTGPCPHSSSHAFSSLSLHLLHQRGVTMPASTLLATNIAHYAQQVYERWPLARWARGH